MQKLAERLLSLRKNQNLTQEVIAQELGIGLRSYCRYEKDEREPDAPTLVRMADFYGVSLDYLVGRSEKRERG